MPSALAGTIVDLSVGLVDRLMSNYVPLGATALPQLKYLLAPKGITAGKDQFHLGRAPRLFLVPEGLECQSMASSELRYLPSYSAASFSSPRYSFGGSTVDNRDGSMRSADAVRPL